jgi:hypothetical protein
MLKAGFLRQKPQRSIWTKPQSPYLTQKPIYKKCENCKHSFMEDGIPVCSLFKYGLVRINNFNYNYYLYAAQCRADTNLCGPEGKYFKEQ